MYEYNATILNVIDGDTFDLDVDLGFDVHKFMRVRLLDVDTPEKRGKEEKELGQICTEYATNHFLGQHIVIKSYKNKDAQTDSFGRYLVYCTLSNGSMIHQLYNDLGINKLFNETYSEDNVLKLREGLNKK